MNIILQKTDHVAESYIVHYKGWNKRYDEVKYLKDIREPQKLIMDPIPGVNDNIENESEPKNKSKKKDHRTSKKIQPKLVKDKTAINKTVKRNNNGIITGKSLIVEIDKVSPQAMVNNIET